MSDPRKLALDQALANLENFSKNATPDLKLSLRQVLNEPNPRSVRELKLAYPQFPDILLQNLLNAASAITSQEPQEPKTTNEQDFKPLGPIGLLGILAIRRKSQEKNALTKAQLQRAVKREAIRQLSEQISEDRTIEAYMLSEDYVFQKWCNERKLKFKNPDEEKAAREGLRENDGFRDRVDNRFVEKNNLQNEVAQKIKIERVRKYTNPEEDPVIRELNKIMLALHRDHVKKTEKQKKKDQDNQKARNGVLGIFANEFPEKTAEYAKWHKKRLENDPSTVGKLKNPISWLTLKDLASFVLGGNNLTREAAFIPAIISPQARTDDEQPQIMAPSTTPSSSPHIKRPSLPKRNPVSRQAEKGAEKAVQQGAKQIGMAAARSLVGAGMGATWYIWVGAAVLLLILVVLVAIFGGGDKNDEFKNAISVNKSVAPKAVPVFNSLNPAASNLTYTIGVGQYPRGTMVILQDAIPENAVFVRADAGARLLDDNGEETLDPSLVNSVVWEIGASASAQPSQPTTGQKSNLVFDENKFIGYGFPKPNSSLTMPDTALKRWQEMLPFAQKAAEQTGVDVGILGMWGWLESNFYSFMNNCNDKTSLSNQNDYCDYNRYLYQIGAFGNHPEYTIGYFKNAFSIMYPGETPKQVGQAVIDKSNDPGKCTKSDCPISNIKTFPDITVDQIYSGATSGNKSMRELLYILYKDDAISAYLAAMHFKDIGLSGLAQKMNKWPPCDSCGRTSGGACKCGSTNYNPQTIINHIKGIYDQSSFSPITQGGAGITFSITLRPKEDAIDTHIINQAIANLIPIDEPATDSGTIAGIGFSNCSVVTVGAPTSDPKLPEECELGEADATAASGSASIAGCGPQDDSGHLIAELNSLLGDPGTPKTCGCGSPSQSWYSQNMVSAEFLGKKFLVHQKIKPCLENASKQIRTSSDAATKNFKLNNDCGSFCFRWMANYNGCQSGNISRHSYGIAIDINPGDNPYLSSAGYHTIPEEFARIMENNGFRWGGRWKKPDYMHFEWAGPIK